MTCEYALEAMLDAERSELDGNGGTPLSTHLRDCARCRGVASRLVQDTMLLAHALPPASVKRPARHAAPTLVPAFALAAIVLAVTLRSRSAGEPVSTAPPATNTVARVAPAVPSPAPPTPNAAAPTRATRVRQTPLRAFARPTAVAPVRFARAVASSTVPVSPGTVTVTPPAGTRATVMQTSNPKLVVVWLY